MLRDHMGSLVIRDYKILLSLMTGTFRGPEMLATYAAMMLSDHKQYIG